jgi:hypothetical protein
MDPFNEEHIAKILKAIEIRVHHGCGLTCGVTGMGPAGAGMVCKS